MIDLKLILRVRKLDMLEKMFRTLTSAPINNDDERIRKLIGQQGLFGETNPPTGKDKLGAAIKKLLTDPKTLHNLYLSLTPFDKKVVSSIVHSDSNKLNESAVYAQYGHLRNGHSNTPPRGMLQGLAILMTEGAIMIEEPAAAFRKSLKDKMEPPEAYRAPIVEELPTALNDPDSKIDYIVHEYECEQTALVDVKSVMLAAESGKIAVSATTGVISKGAATAIRKVLCHGDYYPEDFPPPSPEDCTIGDKGIKTYAWPILLQEANLASSSSKRLRLTTEGKKALGKRPERIIKRLWNAWLKSPGHSEGHRIEMIRGAKRRGMLHPPTESRKGLGVVLKTLPVGKWINIFDFIEYMMITNPMPILTRHGHYFDIERTVYGDFGGNYVTPIFENRFIFAFLVEYAACLGIIDIALTQPWGVSPDLEGTWDFDDCEAISRYDGLQFIRLTPLGNWVLGNTQQYVPAKSKEKNTIKVLPNLDIVVTAEKHPASVEVLLKQLCEATNARVKKLSVNVVLNSISSGIKLSHLREKLKLLSENELPNTVIAFFEDIDRRANLLKPDGKASLIQCYDEATALLIANNKRLKKLCMLAGTNHIAVRKKNVNKFLNALRKEGMTLPASFAD